MDLIILFLAGFAVQLFVARAVDLNEYLDDKLRQSKKEFIKIHIQETSPVQEKSYKVHWDRLWRVPLTSEYRPFTINMFDGIFILDGNRLMAPSLNETSSNKTVALREVDRIRGYSDRGIKFVRSITWKNTTVYLLVCYELDLCGLHTTTRNDSLRFRHTIRHREIPVDAKFFAQGDQLFLVIANNADKFSVPSVIYRWSGTYMDIVGEVMTTGAKSVTAFEHRQSTIITFAQSDVENPRIGSEVYEFKNSNIVRIQFLLTTRPISVHHYVHGDFNFVLMINELEPSNLLCWDGQELLDWFSLSEIESHNLISIFHIDGDTFVIVARDNVVQLYKFHSTSNWKNEDIKRLEAGQEIVDMAVSLNKYTITVMLVIKEKDQYSVEKWEAEMTSVSSENSIGDIDATRKCLSDLIEMLQARMSAIRKAEDSWKFLSPFTKDLTISEPIRFNTLILQSGMVKSIEIAAEGKDILPPYEIQQALNKLDRDINDILLEWQNIVNATVPDILNGKIVVDEAYLDELKIDRMHVDFVNKVDMRPQEAILSKGEQQFANSLRAKSIVVHNLKVDSLCGIPFQYWKLRNNTANTLVGVSDSIEYLNDTVVVHSDLTAHKLIIKSLNGTAVDQLINNLFINNYSQKIKGQIKYTNLLQIVNLTTQMLNDITANKLMTTITNQSFDNFFVKILEIDKLHAETINGVPVEGAARKSRENLIRGKVNLANLRVTKTFMIDLNASLVRIPTERPLQIYENVMIGGDLYLRNAKIDKKAEFFVGNIPVNINDTFNSLWTKSSDQIITKEITFENGVTIDKLNTKYLNGFTEGDFLYTTMEEISRDFTNLHFKNFHLNEFFLEEDRDAAFFDIDSESITIREEVHLQSLHATDIVALAYNGINVSDIMNSNEVNFSEIVRFPAVRARRVFVDNLNLYLLNNREVRFEDGLRVDDNHQMVILKIPEFHVRNLELRRLNGIEMSLLTRPNDPASADLNEIIIDGDLTVENLTVDRIGGQSVERFLKELAKRDIVMTSEKKIDDLIVDNMTLESLHGQNFDTLIADALSKSKEQTVPGRFSAHIITSDNVTMNFVNKRNASQLMWVDEPITITGNVTFTDLFVEGDVNTFTLNGHDVSELYDSLLTVPAKNINLLKVNGNVSWESLSSSPASISNLLKNTVTKNAHQVITGSVIFEKNISAWAVSGMFDSLDKIRDVILDVVLDYGQSVEIGGRKFFDEDFVADSLTVIGDLAIPVINRVNIFEFNNSIIRKNSEETIVAPLIFLQEVKIERLYVNDADVNTSIGAAVRSTDMLPKNVIFENLVVLGDVYLKNLDGINFDDFANGRITLKGDHNIFCDMKFNGLVTVTGNTNIGKINGIRPSDFVLNDIDDAQTISGTKTFNEDLIIEGDVTAPRINNIDIIKEYAESVKNGEDVDIYGDLIFKADVRIQTMNNSEMVNGMNPRLIVSDLREKTNNTLLILKECESLVEKNANYNAQVFKDSHIFLYLEREDNLLISGFNITNVDVLYAEDLTTLNMYSGQPGNGCGLPNQCLCHIQLVAEFSNDVIHIEQIEPGKTMKNFYDPNSTLGVHIKTNTISSSKECTSMMEEFTTISLTRPGIDNLTHTVLSVDVSDEIEGYWKDAAIFKYNGNIYIIVAVYYNKIRATHSTDSLLYRVNAAGEKQSLIQKIPTDGAWSIRIFEIDEHEIFLLIGCVGESAKSLLYRFDSVSQRFEQLRIFISKSRYVKSLSQGKDHFVLLDNTDTNAVDIYKYDPMSRNFYSYQSIFHDRQVNGIECFYADASSNSDAFVVVTTEGGRFYIYEYMFAGKFQIKLQHAVHGLRTMMPFYYMGTHYIFAGTYDDSMIFRIVQQ